MLAENANAGMVSSSYFSASILFLVRKPKVSKVRHQVEEKKSIFLVKRKASGIAALS